MVLGSHCRFKSKFFRERLKEPHSSVLKAIELLKEEGNDLLPEGQLLLQVEIHLKRKFRVILHF